MTQHPSDAALPGKPLPLRAMFLLNAMMAILPFIFYAVFTTKNIKIDGVVPELMLYTGAGYILSFAALVYFILRRNITAIRIIIVLNILIAVPAKATIGILVAIISFALSFNQKVRAYFLAE